MPTHAPACVVPHPCGWGSWSDTLIQTLSLSRNRGEGTSLPQAPFLPCHSKMQMSHPPQTHPLHAAAGPRELNVQSRPHPRGSVRCRGPHEMPEAAFNKQKSIRPPKAWMLQVQALGDGGGKVPPSSQAGHGFPGGMPGRGSRCSEPQRAQCY